MIKHMALLALTVTALSGCAAVGQKSAIQNIATTENPALRDPISAWAAEQQFNGVIAVRPQGKSATIAAFGEADHETGRALTNDSVFQTGSVGKLFVSIAAFKMAEEGLIDLDAPLAEYLPDYRSDIAGKVTTAHLMTNRSGITDKKLRPVMGQIIGGMMANPDVRVEDMPGLPKSLDDAITNYLSEDLLFEPGSQFDYANSNWVILHKILENVAGKPVDQILESYVFAPAGMENSGSFVVDLTRIADSQSDFAIGYDVNSKQFPGDYPLPRFIGGGTYTNAADMVKLMDALYGEKLINAGSLNRFSTVTTEAENYAYGGRVRVDADDPAIRYSWQSGSNGATNMVSVYNMKTGYNFTAMSNHAQEQGDMYDLALALEKIE